VLLHGPSFFNILEFITFGGKEGALSTIPLIRSLNPYRFHSMPFLNTENDEFAVRGVPVNL